MKRVPLADESVIPRISPTHFTRENSARELDVSTSEMQDILGFTDDWKIVGWAPADEVTRREMCFYVILCERDGDRMWVHASSIIVMCIANKVRNDPSRIASLR